MLNFEKVIDCCWNENNCKQLNECATEVVMKNFSGVWVSTDTCAHTFMKSVSRNQSNVFVQCFLQYTLFRNSFTENLWI